MGTNDVGKYKNADDYASLIDQMLSMPDAKVPIIWVDVYNPNQLAGHEVVQLGAARAGRGARQHHGAVVVRSGIGSEGEDPADRPHSSQRERDAGVRRPGVGGGGLSGYW